MRTGPLRPLSQVEIEETIRTDLDALEEATHEFRDVCDAAAEAEVRYKVSKAKAYLRSQGTIKDREYMAENLCEDEHLAYKRAEAAVKSGGELLRTLRTRVDSYRSLNANVRVQV